MIHFSFYFVLVLVFRNMISNIYHLCDPLFDLSCSSLLLLPLVVLLLFCSCGWQSLVVHSFRTMVTSMLEVMGSKSSESLDPCQKHRSRLYGSFSLNHHFILKFLYFIFCHKQFGFCDRNIFIFYLYFALEQTHIPEIFTLCCIL